jgi:TonB-linked SusC/RagA family outer membrane protein
MTLCLPGTAAAQDAKTLRLTGQVFDEHQQPVAGASVIVKGTSQGIQTDAAGKFSFSAEVTPKSILLVQFLGMEPAEQVIGQRTAFKFTLKEDAAQIENVVVTGFQTISKTTFTGSATKLKVEDMNIKGVTDVSRMLEGAAAGVAIQNVSGTFGAAPKVRVRGVTSINGENKPLWVIDGVVQEDIVTVSNDDLTSGDPTTLLGSAVAGISASDIESIDILKDASATALYGARAMNGVVVITTKKGKKGAPRINYTGNFTIRTKPRYSNYDIMNSADQMAVTSEIARKGMLNESILNSSSYGPYGLMWKAISTYNKDTGKFDLMNTRSAREAFLLKYAKANTDWFDELFTHNLQQEHTLSISTGSDKSRTYASIGFLRDDGWSVADEVSRYTLNFRNDYTVSEKISVGVQAVASFRDQSAPGSYSRKINSVTGEWSREFDINPFSYALNTSRAVRPYDDNGNLEYVQMNYAPFNIFNELENNKIELNVVDAKLQGEFNWSILKDLKFNFTGALRYVKSDQLHKITEDSNVANAYRAAGNSTIRQNNPYLWHNTEDLNAEPIVVLPLGGFYNTNNYRMLNYDIRYSLNYNKVWDGAHMHELNALAGMQIKYTDRRITSATQPGYQYKMGGVVYNDPNFYRMMADRKTDLYSAEELFDRFVAAYANADYSFDRKYSISATIRVDGSNALGKSANKRWLPTWNFGAKWNIQNESFMENASDWVDVLSLRLSYGLTASMPQLASAGVVFRNQQSFNPGHSENQIYIEALENSDLTWEKTRTYNLGLDLTLWRKSYQFNAGLDVTLFNNRMNFSFDYFNRKGFDLIATVKTSGIGGEFWKYANYADLDSHGYDITLGGTFIRSKDWTWSANFTLGYTWNRIKNAKNLTQTNELIRNEGGNKEGYPVNSLFSIPYAGLEPGTGIPLYINEKGEITKEIDKQGTDTDYLIYEGQVDPKWTGGFNTTVRYKNLSLNAFFTYQAGNVIRLDPIFSQSYSDLAALTNEFKNRYVMSGDSDVPAILDYVHNSISITDAGTYASYNYTGKRVAKGDFIRLKSISLNYDFSSDWISKSRFFKTASVRFTVKDPWLIYSDKALNGRDPEFYNTGGVAMPTTTQFTLSLNLGF